MLVFFAILSLASAANLLDNRLQIVHSGAQRLDGLQAPISLVQLLRSPVQNNDGRRETVQYIRQNQFELHPQRQQYSIVSVEPRIQQTVQTLHPNNQQIILSSVEPNFQQYSLEEVQPNGQQLTILSVQPNAQQLSIGELQQITDDKQIILQPIEERKQLVAIVEPNLQRNQGQNIQIAAQVQPLEYSSVIQPVQHSSSHSSQIHSRQSSGADNRRDSGRNAQNFSYFLRGSDLDNQRQDQRVVVQGIQSPVTVTKQLLEVPQYSSVLDPRVLSVVIQPSGHVQEVVQPQVGGLITYSSQLKA